MDKKTLGNVLGVLAAIFFAIAIIGMATHGSHRWVEPFEEAGWLLFVGCVLALYLMARQAPEDAGPGARKWESAAWGFGALAVVLFVVAIISNAAMATSESWVEAVELAGVLAMLVTIISAIYARGGFGRTKA